METNQTIIINKIHGKIYIKRIEIFSALLNLTVIKLLSKQTINKRNNKQIQNGYFRLSLHSYSNINITVISLIHTCMWLNSKGTWCMPW